MTDYVPYQAYLIRVWPTRLEGVAGCRVSLRSVTTGECEDFAGLESLLAFLEARISDREDPGRGEHAPSTEASRTARSGKTVLA